MSGDGDGEESLRREEKGNEGDYLRTDGADTYQLSSSLAMASEK